MTYFLLFLVLLQSGNSAKKKKETVEGIKHKKKTRFYPTRCKKYRMGKGKFEIKLTRVIVYIQPCYETLNLTTYITCIQSDHVTGPVVAQRVGRGIALLFHDCGTRRRCVVSVTPRPYFTPRKDPVPIVQEAEWVPGPVWTGGKSRPTGIRSPDRPARSQSLYRLSYITSIYSVHTSQGILCVSITKTSIKAAWGNNRYFIRNARNTNGTV